MKALQVEYYADWYKPVADIYLIDDFSDFKKGIISEKFDFKSINDIKVGTFIDDGIKRITMIDIED